MIVKCQKCGREYEEYDYLTYEHICEVCKGKSYHKEVIRTEMFCAVITLILFLVSTPLIVKLMCFALILYLVGALYN